MRKAPETGPFFLSNFQLKPGFAGRPHRPCVILALYGRTNEIGLHSCRRRKPQACRGAGPLAIIPKAQSAAPVSASYPVLRSAPCSSPSCASSTYRRHFPVRRCSEISTRPAARRLRHVWYQMDKRDRDTATFFYYLREATACLRTVTAVIKMARTCQNR